MFPLVSTLPSEDRNQPCDGPNQKVCSQVELDYSDQ
jgi:hypothetical protein